MGIRKILYGYEIRAGRKEICPGEAEIVRQVFALYPAGFSYQKIAEALNQRNVSYGETNSPWNKARIKRILEDERYTGQKGYPVIIKEADFQAVQSTIQNNSVKRTQTAPEPEAEMLLPVSRYLHCALCGTPLVGHGGRGQKPENAYLRCGQCKVMFRISKAGLLKAVEEQLRAHEQTRPAEYQPSAEVIRLTNLIHRTLENPDQPEEAMRLILQAASARYECCPDTDHIQYETLSEVPAKQLDSLIQQISISADSIVTVHFKA